MKYNEMKQAVKLLSKEWNLGKKEAGADNDICAWIYLFDVLQESEKIIKDTEWIEIMERTIPYIDNILRNPNRFIINEEEIVKIERARRITVESIKNLSKNTSFIQEIDENRRC